MPGNVPTGISTGTGSLFSKEIAKTLAAATRFVLPAGSYYIYALGADMRLQVADSGGGWNNLSAAGGPFSGVQVSDGASLAVYNGGAGAEAFTYILLP